MVRRYLLFLLAASCFLLTRSQSTDGDSIFNSPGVHTIHITFSQPGWYDSLVAYKTIDKWLMGTVGFNGHVMDSCGIQFKGNSSYNSYPGDKKPFNISFDEFAPDQRYDGINTINLNNNFKDPTMMREKVFLDFCIRNGIAAPRATYANLYINGVHWGFYTLIEQVNKDFLKDWNASDNEGNLYKGDPQGSLQWFGSNPSSYFTRYEKKTNTGANDWSDLVHLIDKLNNTPPASFQDSLEAVLDTDSWIKAWAVNNLFSSLDSYNGSGHNYYLYRDSVFTRKFHFIVWDANESFGNFRQGLTRTQLETLSAFYTPTPAGSRPLMEKMLANPAYKQRYADQLCQYIYNDFDSTWLFPHIDSLVSVIRPHVNADTNKQFSINAFDININNTYTSNPPTPGGGDFSGLKSFVRSKLPALKNELLTWGCAPVSIPESSAGEFVVFPNPARQSFTVRSAMPLQDITLHDIHGRRLRHIPANGGTEQSVSLEGIPAGICILRIGDRTVRKLEVIR